MRRATSIVSLVFVLLVVLCLGCTSAPEAAEAVDRMATSAKGPTTGDSSAETRSNEMPVGLAVAWGASSAENKSLSSKWSPTQTSSGTGSVVTGFVQGLTVDERAEVRSTINERLQTDPVLQSIAAELTHYAGVLETVGELTPDQAARLTEVRAEFTAARKSIFDELANSGLTGNLDLGSLSKLIVVGIVHSNVGKEERPPTDEEAKNLGRMLANIINAAEGNTQILGPDESVEGGDEPDPKELEGG